MSGATDAQEQKGWNEMKGKRIGEHLLVTAVLAILIFISCGLILAIGVVIEDPIFRPKECLFGLGFLWGISIASFTVGWLFRSGRK